MVYTITSEEGYKKENTIICDTNTDNRKLAQTILDDVRIPPNLTGLEVSVERYFAAKFCQPASPLRQPVLDKIPVGSDGQTEAELTNSFSQFLDQNEKENKISKE